MIGFTGRTVPCDKIIISEGRWTLTVPDVTTTNKYNSTLLHLGWQCVITHDCEGLKGTPYWMLIQKGYDTDCCMYCKTEIPDSISTSFVMLNWHMFNRG